VSQTAFIMNTTLRQNILFGEVYEQERYERVLEACCLWPDIDLMGEAGDLTEIGMKIGSSASALRQQSLTVLIPCHSQASEV
jgi:ABC-type multidrug transport system fused ATPase/permease subunit